MSVNKAGGTNIYATSTPASASAVVDILETQLAAAGWTVVSGAGTDAIVFQSAATTQGSYSMRVTTSVTSGRVRLKAAKGDGTNEQSNYFANLIPDTSTPWHIAANRYGFVIFEEGKRATAQKFALASCLYLPTAKAAQSTNQFYAGGDLFADGNASANDNFHNGGRTPANGNTSACYLAAASAYIEHHSSNNDYSVRPRFFSDVSRRGESSVVGPAWFNGDVFVADALMLFGNDVNSGDLCFVQGWMFDVIILHGVNYTDGTEVTFDGDDYVVFGGSDGVVEYKTKACLAFLKPA